MNNFSNQPGNYYAQVTALTPKDKSIAEQKIPSVIEKSSLNILFSPFFIYGIIILFFIFFLGAIIIQISQRVFSFKNSFKTLIVAFVIAVIPLTLKSALQYSTFQTNAAPDEIPKNLTINQLSPNSVEIIWNTDIEKMGSVKICIFSMKSSSCQNSIANSGKKDTKHKAIVTDLKLGIVYEIEILSGSNWYNNDGNPIKFELK